VVENAGLALGDGVAGIVGTQMAAMAGEENGRVCIEDASHFGIQHRQQRGGNSLIRQTKFARMRESGSPLARCWLFFARQFLLKPTPRPRTLGLLTKHDSGNACA
jgi:hypothetical protein